MGRYTESSRIPGTGIFVNPGSSDLEGAKYKHAENNMRSLSDDLGPGWKFSTVSEEDEGGRFHFTLWNKSKGKQFSILMPGYPLEEVRYIGAEDQNIWDFPRLYVDGSSWIWQFALGIILDEGETDD
jgi:hypothetical protein